MKATPQIGVCSYCGCTDDTPCRLPDNESCGWVNKLKTCCSKWSCTQAWMSERKRGAALIRREIREMRMRLFDRQREEREQRKAARAKMLRPAPGKRPKGRVA